MLDTEASLHSEHGALLDREWLVLQRVEGAGSGEIDDDILTALDLEAERENDNFAWVVGVAESVAAADTEGLLPFAERLVVLV